MNQDIKRLKEIVLIFSRHGFSYWIENTSLRHHLPFGRKKEPKHPLQVELRLALEELGPTFVKFGQILSTRPDLVPEEVTKELEKLQDNVPPFRYEEVCKQIEDSFGKKINEIFKSFDKEPIASASLAQVHKAILRTNGKGNGKAEMREEIVAVKIQRPNITNRIKDDMHLLMYVAKILDHNHPNESFSFTEMVEEFKRQLGKELRFDLEANHIDKFRENFKHDKDVVIPKVYWDYTNNKILTMEFIEGVPMNKISDAGSNSGIKLSEKERKLISKRIVDSSLKQVFEHRLFHADPHPGNILLLRGKNNMNKIGILDFGSVGTIQEDLADNLADLIIAMISKDTETITEVFSNIGFSTPHTNLDGMRRDIEDALEGFEDLKISEVGNTLIRMIHAAKVNNLKIPHDFILLGKALATMESTAKKINPELNPIKESEPFLKKFVKERLDPMVAAKDIKGNLFAIYRLFKKFPHRADRILSQLESGRLNVHLEHENLHELEREIDRSSNRVALGSITAAIIIASALLLQVSQPLLWSMPLFSAAGFILAFMLGAKLSWSIVKSGRF